MLKAFFKNKFDNSLFLKTMTRPLTSSLCLKSSLIDIKNNFAWLKKLHKQCNCVSFFFVLFHMIILNVAHTTRRKNREKPDNFQKPPKNDFTVIYGKLSFSFLMGQ